jgi:hypothetical protein
MTRAFPNKNAVQIGRNHTMAGRQFAPLRLAVERGVAVRPPIGRRQRIALLGSPGALVQTAASHAVSETPRE